MSAKIWQDLQSAVGTQRPDLVIDFKACRNREDIVSFMNTHFPLTEQMVGDREGATDWNNHISLKISEMLDRHKDEAGDSWGD